MCGDSGRTATNDVVGQSLALMQLVEQIAMAKLAGPYDGLPARSPVPRSATMSAPQVPDPFVGRAPHGLAGQVNIRLETGLKCYWV